MEFTTCPVSAIIKAGRKATTSSVMIDGAYKEEAATSSVVRDYVRDVLTTMAFRLEGVCDSAPAYWHCGKACSWPRKDPHLPLVITGTFHWRIKG